jgi:hypothetical protein
MSQIRSTPEIYFHVGLGKVASTYLQYRFFPKLQGIYYIQRTRYRNYRRIIDNTAHAKYLVSREFDQQLPAEVESFAQHYPDARIIILLRRHDSWIASQYRRFAKNGIHQRFEEFFDIDNDEGLWKQQDLYYMPKLRIIEQYFRHKPLVLFHDELKQDPFALMDRMADFMGVSYDHQQISLKPVHRSYSEKQLKLVRRLSRYVFKPEPVTASSHFLRQLQKRKQLLTSYAIMAAAPLVPTTWLGEQSLIPGEKLAKIREAYMDDWRQCQRYAAGELA